MLLKYGKKIDMRNINRDVDKIQKMIVSTKQSASKYLNVNSNDNVISCRICNSKQSNFFVNVYEYIYHECEVCGSIFLVNLPNIKKLYSDIPDTPVEHYINKDVFNKRVEMIAKPKVNYIFNIANKNNINLHKWLDIGCGTGEILYEVKKHNCEVIGIESDLREIDFARKINGINIIEGFLDDENKNENIIKSLKLSSIVSFFNVLEHIQNPANFIDYIYENMNKGSLLVFEVPRYPSLASFVNLMSSSNVYRHIVPPQHLQIFTEKSIDIILDGKFEIISKWGFGQGFFDILTNSVLNANVENLNLYNDLIDISNEVQEVIDEKGYSDTMIFICRKL